jgi:hypothetical protein
MNLVFDCRGIDKVETSILSALGLLHNEEAGHAWASVSRLVFMTKWSESSIKRRLSTLKKKGLIERTLREEDPTTSRATWILWNKLFERRGKFVPNEKKVKREVQNQPTNLASDIAADLAVADTSDEATPGIGFALRDKQVVVEEIVALLEKHFSGHPTFQDVDSRKIMYDCVWACMRKTESAEQCLAIFEWICTDPDNEPKRNKMNSSVRLGGYIKACFKDWSKGYQAVAEEYYPNFENILTSLCEGNSRVQFREAMLPRLQPFRAWIESRIGANLLSIDMTWDSEYTYLLVDIDAGFKASHRAELSQTDGQPVG